jgi:hypothetical protein
LETSESRKDTIERGSIFFRAQRGYPWRMENQGDEEGYELAVAYALERMTPKAEFVRDGRANPHGIPSLCLASTAETAMAEVRPWGSYISLAQFQLMKGDNR